MSCAKALKKARVESPFGCCESCHVDWEDYGMHLREVGIDGKRFEVCCQVGGAIDETLRARTPATREGDK